MSKKQAPVFIIRNVCVVIPCAVIAVSTGNRIFLLLCRVSSPPASQDIYCYCHNDLIEAKSLLWDWSYLHCKLGPLCKDGCTSPANFKAYFDSVIVVNVKWKRHLHWNNISFFSFFFFWRIVVCFYRVRKSSAVQGHKGNLRNIMHNMTL